MLVHDIADPIMEIAKLFLYHGYKRLADLFFLIFAVVFVVTRDYYFLVNIVLFVCRHVWLGIGWVQMPYFAFLLGSLQVMQFIWTAMIARMAVTAIITKKTPKDVREEDD